MNPALDEAIDCGYQRPRDPLQIWLARQWQEDVLGFAVGIRENFSGIGGNSLDAARVIDAILVEFGVQVPLRVLTEHPAVERLATLLRDHAAQLSGSLVAIQDGGGTRPPLVLGGTPHRSLSARRLCHRSGDRLRDGRPARRVRLMAAIDAELLEPPDTGTASWSREPPWQPDLPRILASRQEHDLVPQNVAPEFVARSLRAWRANQDAVRDWQPSPYTGPLDVFGLQSITALPTTVVQRTHECDADGRLVSAFRELVG